MILLMVILINQLVALAPPDNGWEGSLMQQRPRVAAWQALEGLLVKLLGTWVSFLVTAQRCPERSLNVFVSRHRCSANS